MDIAIITKYIDRIVLRYLVVKMEIIYSNPGITVMYPAIDKSIGKPFHITRSQSMQSNSTDWSKWNNKNKGFWITNNKVSVR
jgi:hypothetical protein